MSKYTDLYNRMESNIWYTAAELDVVPATMTAMVNRKFVEKTDTSPKKYRKINNYATQIIELVKNSDFFTLYKTNHSLGMLCSLKNDVILDCWCNPYDLTDVVSVSVKGKNYPLS